MSGTNQGRVLGLAVATALTLSACASAPINLAGEPEAGAETQLDLRGRAEALSVQVEAAGWTLAREDAARGFLGRLIGGGDDSSADDPVAAYLAWPDGAPADQALADLSALNALTMQVVDAVRAVSDTMSGLDLETLDRDIAAAERALGAARRAHDFFDEVANRLHVDAELQDALVAALDRQAVAEDSLAEAADALAQRRWALRSGLVG